MSNRKAQITFKITALASVISELEATLGKTRAKYWEKVQELYALDDEAPAMSEVIERIKTGKETAEDVFRVAEGAVKNDDT